MLSEAPQASRSNKMHRPFAVLRVTGHRLCQFSFITRHWPSRTSSRAGTRPAPTRDVVVRRRDSRGRRFVGEDPCGPPVFLLREGRKGPPLRSCFGGQHSRTHRKERDVCATQARRAHTFSSAISKSRMMSCQSSSPMESRTPSGCIPKARFCSSGRAEWVIEKGCSMSVLICPRLTARVIE
jgi:hypothetical protein